MSIDLLAGSEHHHLKQLRHTLQERGQVGSAFHVDDVLLLVEEHLFVWKKGRMKDGAAIYVNDVLLVEEHLRP